MRWNQLLTVIFLVALIAGSAPQAQQRGAEQTPTSDVSQAQKPQGDRVVMRRLSESQYLQAIAYVFGADIEVPRTFEPEARRDGLLALGASRAAISPWGLEQHRKMARVIATKAVDEEHRAAVVPCRPVAENKADDGCAAQFYATVGRLLFRRPLTNDMMARFVAAARAGADRKGFHGGLADGLALLLIDPRFLFRWEMARADDPLTLDDYSRATRLSYFLWNATPDAALLDAAAKGELSSPAGLKAQVYRLMASPQFKAGLRAFFSDMLGFDGFDNLTKDSTIYPKFSQAVARDATEQTMRTLEDHLVDRNGDFRKLFTLRETFLTRNLAMVYNVPFRLTYGGAWQRYTFPPDSPYVGLLTQVSFTALHAYPGRSSATLRGKAFRELLTCEKIPSPPADVDFKLVETTTHAVLKTARDRLTQHRNNPVCAGCHRLMDPIGLGFENFDGIGGYRTMENGKEIDASGEFNGMKFANSTGMGQALSESPAVSACVVKRFYEYGSGRTVQARARTADGDTVRRLVDAFAKDGYQVPALLRRIALDESFYVMPRN